MSRQSFMTSLSLRNFTSHPISSIPPSRLPTRISSPRSFGTPKQPYRRSYNRFQSTEPPSASAHPAPPSPPTQRSRLRRFIGFTSLAAFAFTLGLTYQTQRTVSRIMASPFLTDEETLSAYHTEDPTTAEIDTTLRTHPVAEALRADPDFKEARPHLKIPETMRERNFTAGTLAGPGKIVVPPYVFSERTGKSMVSLMYLGGDVCGHQGIIHGGLLATLLDEGLARCCFPALPNKVGVTANLNIDYRAPAMADQYVALRAETVKVEGRKAWVEGRIETLPTDGTDPVVLVEAKALFIEPKQAAALASLYRAT